MMFTDEYFMRIALQEAQKAYDAHEVPVGAVMVVQHTVIAKGHNQVERLQDATAHAEMIALTAAFEALGSKYVPQGRLYVTLEPCIMCSGALYWAQLGALIFGARDQKHGYQRINHRGLHPKTVLKKNILQSECEQLLLDFFKKQRK